MISILGCPWLPLPPCLPSSSPFMISILGCSWLPLPPCPPSFVFQPCLCSLLPLPPRLPSLFFGNAIWGLCRYNFLKSSSREDRREGAKRVPKEKFSSIALAPLEVHGSLTCLLWFCLGCCRGSPSLLMKKRRKPLLDAPTHTPKTSEN